MRAMLDGGHDLTPGGAIGSQLVGDDALGRQALLLQQPDQQSLGGLGVAAGLNDFIQDISVLIHGAPQPASSRCHTSLEDGDLRCNRAVIMESCDLHHRRIVSYETATPRSSIISSTSRRLTLNRKYSQIARATISIGKR